MPNDTRPLPEPYAFLHGRVKLYTQDDMHAHAAAVSAAKDAEIAELRGIISTHARIALERDAEIAALRAEYERACKLVADMHAAAMGAKVGPLLDVVGDVAAVVHKNTALQKRIKVLEDALRDALDRMDRARDILTDGKPRPECNWGMLATEVARAALGDKT